VLDADGDPVAEGEGVSVGVGVPAGDAEPDGVALGLASEAVGDGVALAVALGVAVASGVGSADATAGAPTSAAETSRAPSARAPGRSRVVSMVPSSAVQDVMPETAGGPACSGSVPHSSTVVWSRSRLTGIPTRRPRATYGCGTVPDFDRLPPDRCVWVPPLRATPRCYSFAGSVETTRPPPVDFAAQAF
jgi:hypothetical protein